MPLQVNVSKIFLNNCAFKDWIMFTGDFHLYIYLFLEKFVAPKGFEPRTIGISGLWAAVTAKVKIFSKNN